MRQFIIGLALLALLCTPSWAVEEIRDTTLFPLLGLWEATAAGSKTESLAALPRTEVNFSEGGQLTFTTVDPSGNSDTPVQLHFHYIFQPPDVVTFSLDGQDKVAERYQFKIDGDNFSWKQLDYGTTGAFRRIKKTGFLKKPTDLKEIPQSQ